MDDGSTTDELGTPTNPGIPPTRPNGPLPSPQPGRPVPAELEESPNDELPM